MKTTLVCTDCSHRFSVPDSFDREFVRCPECYVHGSVVGVIREGVRIFFSDTEETTQLPVVEAEATDG